MDSVFSFSEAARHDFLQSTLTSYGCTYICLWSYSSSSNRLLFLDGLYDVLAQSQQASSSMGSVDRRLFGQYRGLEFDVSCENRVPGLAFWNQYSYLELQQSDLLRLAWTDIQRQFFQEARIETAVFIGCHHGEIELGFSFVSHGAEIQTDVQNWFPEEFSGVQSHQVEQKIPPLRSLSTGSSDQDTSLLFSNIPSSSLLPEMLLMQQANEHDDGKVKAILHVISSPSSERVSAFKRYRAYEMSHYKPNLLRKSLLKRSLEMLRGLHFMRTRELYEASHHTSSQFLHMLSERRRREKLNRNFQALRSLLPPETKKDKASILIAATETLSSLMAEIEKMAKRDEEQQVKEKMKGKEQIAGQEAKTRCCSTDERLISVRVSDVAAGSWSSSEGRFTNLHVTVRRRRSYYFVQQVDILSPLLEFLKRIQRVSLISVDATTHIAQGSSINEATFRLKIEGNDWDEAAFEEAVRRVVADLARGPITT